MIGAGSVGATIAYTLSNEDIATEIVLIDINKQKAEGEVMDIIQGTCFRDPISIKSGRLRGCKGLQHRHHYVRRGQKTRSVAS